MLNLVYFRSLVQSVLKVSHRRYQNIGKHLFNASPAYMVSEMPEMHLTNLRHLIFKVLEGACPQIP